MKSVKQNIATDKAASFGEVLLGWYDSNARVLPWRYRSEETPDPYRVWLSEIMLQQTTVKAVVPYFLKFIERWPSVQALAAADPEELMAAWAGLGYYARARNLLACAKVVSSELGGIFPEDELELRKLPGIGPYTSAAIRAIAFNKPAVVVDGNVERVLARVHPKDVSGPKDKPTIRKLAEPYYDYAGDNQRSGDLAQAFMDLGARVCIPKVPRCGVCPVHKFCGSKIEGLSFAANDKAAALRPRRYGHVYWIEDGQGSILLERRPAKGLLGGMVGFPCSEWFKGPHADIKVDSFFSDFDLRQIEGAKVTHTFTHFDLALEVYAHKNVTNFDLPKGCFWKPLAELEDAGFPGLFMKVFKLMRDHEF